MFSRKHDRIKALLPLYEDKELSPEERRLVEGHLKICDECRAEWDSLRWAVSLLKEVPRVPAPRSFVVRATAVERVQVPVGFYVARAFTALAAALFILLLGFDLLMAKFAVARVPVYAPIATEVPSPEFERIKSVPIAPFVTKDKEISQAEKPSPESPIPLPTQTPTPLPERSSRLPLRWLPWEIALGLSAIAGGVASFILNRRR